MATEIGCGSLRSLTIDQVTARVVQAVMGFKRAERGVGIEPSGRVYVDDPDDIPMSDLVGVYRAGGMLELAKEIRDDLTNEAKERGLVRVA